jgi:hypothetical protein
MVLFSQKVADQLKHGQLIINQHHFRHACKLSARDAKEQEGSMFSESIPNS